ncbi:MAG: PilZ domain-containing protein [Deltaproteobacteria bacterium]|nr:PilZ domain-containing protein [Deltaproteobacteria bacterium]
MKVLGFLYKGRERRLAKRHTVRWDAFLEVRFPDFHDQIPVEVVNFSAGGALLHSEQLTVDNRHLVIAETKPELTLKISLPERVLELTSRIEWYEVLDEKSIFEIGTSFVDFKNEANISVDELIKIMGADK